MKWAILKEEISGVISFIIAQRIIFLSISVLNWEFRMEGFFILAICETLELFHKTLGLWLSTTVHCK